jgi:preprotein translocase subunit YajC
MEVCMLAILAQNQAQPNAIVSFLPLLLIGVVFYFLLIRPQNQRRRAQMEMQSSIEVGDDIVSTAGIYGTITEIDDDYGIVTVEVAPNTEIRLARAAIAQRLVDDGELEDEDEVEGAEPGS